MLIGLSCLGWISCDVKLVHGSESVSSVKMSW